MGPEAGDTEAMRGDLPPKPPAAGPEATPLLRGAGDLRTTGTPEAALLK